jgi:hypothetical protein
MPAAPLQRASNECEINAFPLDLFVFEMAAEQ